jgi:hypothetical protein
MILEGVVTTVDRLGRLNVAPMGPIVPDDAPAEFATFLLRPFPSSRTYANLAEVGEGVLHATDDALLIARATIGDFSPPTEPTTVIRGRRLSDCCRFFEFRIVERDESGERPRLLASVVHRGRNRDFFGFNRAKHAVLEAAILASRVGILPWDEILRDLDRLLPLVEKTGGPSEREAFTLLRDHIHAAGPKL